MKKSHASMLAACARRNSCQLGPERLGAGPRPARARAANGARRDGEAELRKLGRDALIAPARVPPREPQHQLTSLGVRRRAPWAATRVCPSPSQELAVPVQQGLGRDEQTTAARRRELAACSGEERAVTGSQLWALDLTTQDIQLVAQHDQLDVLDLRGPAATNQQLQQGDEDEIDEGDQHRAMLPEPFRGWRSGQIRVLAPFRHASCLWVPPRVPPKPEYDKTPATGGGFGSTATGIRTRVSAMRGRRPSPLDDSGAQSTGSRLAKRP